MGRFVRSQLLHRPSRPIALGVGILVAALTFTLLTSAVTTSALELRGTVQQNFRSAYDILVRPSNSYTPLERDEGLVRANYLSGIFGGITLDQWHSILNIPGVEVAAPIEMIGYILPFQKQVIRLNRYLNDAPYQIYRIQQTRVANGGSSRYPDADLYVYYSRDHRFVDQQGLPQEVVPGRRGTFDVCNYPSSLTPRSPFDLRYDSYENCFSGLSPQVGRAENGPPFGKVVGITTDQHFPVLLAAIDPIQEDRLVGFDQTIVSGEPLQEGQRWRLASGGLGSTGIKARFAPVVASTQTYVRETLEAKVERLHLPAGIDLPSKLASGGPRAFLDRLHGKVVGEQNFPTQEVYRRLLKTVQRQGLLANFDSYRITSAVKYRVLGTTGLPRSPRRTRRASGKASSMRPSSPYRPRTKTCSIGDSLPE